VPHFNAVAWGDPLLLAYISAAESIGVSSTTFTQSALWFVENDLLLNADKSEVMMIGTPAQLRAASTVNTVAVADANLTLLSKLKSLGVILGSRLSFDAHVAMVCKTYNYHILALRHIWRLLPRGADAGLLHRRLKAGLL